MSVKRSNTLKRSVKALDTLFRGPRKGGTVSRAGGTHIPRPQSESDMPDMEETENLIYQMDENEMNKKFEEMLNDMNLSEEKKEPLRNLPSNKKKKMLSMHVKGSNQETKSKFDRPSDYIAYLSQSDLSCNKLYVCMESLRIALTNNTLSWVHEFGTPGLKLIYSTLEMCCSRNDRYEKLQYECLRCLRVVMNNTESLKQVLELKDGILVVAQCLDSSRPSVMVEALKILAALCLVPDMNNRPVGHERTLEAVTTNGERKRHERFKPVIEGLRVPNNVNLWSVCMQFINAVILQADDFDYRVHLRNEFVRNGLIDLLEPLRNLKIDQIKVQLTAFDEQREEDCDELLQRFDNVKVDMDDMNDCFEVLKNTTLDTPAEPFFLSILQHLLFIRDDLAIKPAYFKLIEECVSQIVLHRNGYDPDFRANRRFQIDVQPLIEELKEKSRVEEIEQKQIEQLNRKLEEAIAQSQEKSAKIAYLENKLLQGGGSENFPDGGQGALSPQNKANIAKALAGPGAGVPPPPPPPGLMGPPPPPMPGMGGPPPPPMPGMGGPPPPPMPGMGGPPPPPMMGMGGPAPPPFPGMGPPPMPGMMVPRPEVLPYGLKPKKKWDTIGPLKRANWKTIIPQKMSEKSFWVKCQEDKLASPEILSGLAARFSSKPAVKKNDDVDNKMGTVGPAKKVKELKVLDGKAAQNISILLGGSLKHMSYSKVKTCLLRCDDTILTGNVLEHLIQYLPPPEQLKKLQELGDSYDQLTEAEQFCCTISEVKRLLPRLKSLSFRQHYQEMVNDVKPDIVAGTAACEEVKGSTKFAKILELILLLGNYMNSGSRNGQAFGFEFSFLTKLTGTKDLDNKQTLLHYLAETVEKKFPELLNFYDELSHVDKASRVSLDSIQKTLRQMMSSVKNLETDLANSKVPQSEDDRFCEVMTSFANEAREQCTVLQEMFKNMDTLYTDISEYYAFDKAKYNLEEFFTDLKTFKDSFIDAHKDNVREREIIEKNRRQKEAQEKAEKERQERAARKRLVDMNPSETQQGVMDSLLEALQTGSAFSREQKRRRGPRVAGAERRAQLARSRSRTGLVATGLTGRELSSEILGSA